MATEMHTNEVVDEEYIECPSGAWNNMMDKKERVGLTVKRFIDICSKTFKDFDAEMLLNVVWDKGYDSLVKTNTKYGRKEKRKEAEFQCSIKKKPPRSGFIVFNMEYSEKCKSEGVKYENRKVSLMWRELSDVERTKYNNKAKSLNEEYHRVLDEEKAIAIKNGTIARPKPKRPINEWIIFRKEIYREVASNIKIDEEHLNSLSTDELKTKYRREIQRQIMDEILVRWKNISPETMTRLTNIKLEKRKEYELAMQEWQKYEYDRLSNSSNKMIPHSSDNEEESAEPSDTNIELVVELVVELVAEPAEPVAEPVVEPVVEPVAELEVAVQC